VVEFALVLPVLLLILLVAIDFGRALYGWVVIQNSARVAANFAGMNASGWQSGSATTREEYEDTILLDFSTANCEKPAAADLPEPAFTDGPDTAHPDGPPDTNFDVGDTVVVELDCDFQLVTPVVGAILGDTIQIAGRSEFRIRAGKITGLADPPQIPPPPPCTISADFDRAPDNVNSGDPVTFTNTSTASNCTIESFEWTFELGNPATASGAGPHDVTFTVPAEQDVTATLTITSSTGSTDSFSDTVLVRP
jgi:hypothetical protein